MNLLLGMHAWRWRKACHLLGCRSLSAVSSIQDDDVMCSNPGSFRPLCGNLCCYFAMGVVLRERKEEGLQYALGGWLAEGETNIYQGRIFWQLNGHICV